MLVPPEKLTRKELEAKVSRDVSDYMKKKGWRRLRQQSAMVTRLVAGGAEAGQAFRIGEKGMPDLLFYFNVSHEVYPGLCAVVWIETKRAQGGKLSEDQMNWQDTERLRGSLVFNVSNVAEWDRLYSKNLAWIHTFEGQGDLF